MQSPSRRYELVYGVEYAVPTLRPHETVPPEKPFLLTPTTGGAQMYILDHQTGTVTTLIDERAEYEPVSWLP
jgi:hypothetical protein